MNMAKGDLARGFDSVDLDGMGTIALQTGSEGSVAVTRETIIRLTKPIANATTVTDQRLFGTFGGRDPSCSYWRTRC
jgi:hypothetical protein